MERETLGYTLALGITPLRERIARHYRERYGVDVDPERIVVTGSSAAFVPGVPALFDAEARRPPSPGYPCYRHIDDLLPPGRDRDGSTDAMMPRRTRSRRSSTASTGCSSPAPPIRPARYTPQRLAALVALCRDNGLWFISDEIYHGLTWDQPAESALQYGDDVIVINSFSKYYSMTGWRVGWLVAPPALGAHAGAARPEPYIAPPAAAQVAALAAFEAGDELEANRRVYAANRALLLEELPKAGFDRFAPADGAFYLYADVSDVTDDSAAFARAMLEETGVAATPGVDFDARAAGTSSAFICGWTEEMAEAARQLQRWRRLAGRVARRQQETFWGERPRGVRSPGDRSFAQIEQDGLEGLLDLEIRAADAIQHVGHGRLVRFPARRCLGLLRSPRAVRRRGCMSTSGCAPPSWPCRNPWPRRSPSGPGCASGPPRSRP